MRRLAQCQINGKPVQLTGYTSSMLNAWPSSFHAAQALWNGLGDAV